LTVNKYQQITAGFKAVLDKLKFKYDRPCVTLSLNYTKMLRNIGEYTQKESFEPMPSLL